MRRRELMAAFDVKRLRVDLTLCRSNMVGTVFAAGPIRLVNLDDDRDVILTRHTWSGEIGAA